VRKTNARNEQCDQRGGNQVNIRELVEAPDESQQGYSDHRNNRSNHNQADFISYGRKEAND
jgi:hypothetical protein